MATIGVYYYTLAQSIQCAFALIITSVIHSWSICLLKQMIWKAVLTANLNPEFCHTRLWCRIVWVTGLWISIIMWVISVDVPEGVCLRKYIKPCSNLRALGVDSFTSWLSQIELQVCTYAHRSNEITCNSRLIACALYLFARPYSLVFLSCCNIHYLTLPSMPAFPPPLSPLTSTGQTVWISLCQERHLNGHLSVMEV